MKLSADALVAAFDCLSEGVQVLSPEWEYLYLNEAAARHGRTTRDALLGRSLLACYPGVEKTPLFGVMARCMSTGRAETLENEFHYPDGHPAWFDLHIQRCPQGIIVVSHDITARKHAEEELRLEHVRSLRQLATPVIRVHEGVLLVPLIGSLDGHRASAIMDTVLTRVSEDAARVLILDVAGVSEMGTDVAQLLVETTAAVKLLGTRTILTGLTAIAAMTIGKLGLDLSTMTTTTHLARGLELALRAAPRG